MFYVIIFYYYILEVCSFLVKDRKGVDSEGERINKKLGGVEGGKPVISMYRVRMNRIYFQLKYVYIYNCYIYLYLYLY